MPDVEGGSGFGGQVTREAQRQDARNAARVGTIGVAVHPYQGCLFDAHRAEHVGGGRQREEQAAVASHRGGLVRDREAEHQRVPQHGVQASLDEGRPRVFLPMQVRRDRLQPDITQAPSFQFWISVSAETSGSTSCNRMKRSPSGETSK